MTSFGNELRALSDERHANTIEAAKKYAEALFDTHSPFFKNIHDACRVSAMTTDYTSELFMMSHTIGTTNAIMLIVKTTGKNFTHDVQFDMHVFREKLARADFCNCIYEHMKKFFPDATIVSNPELSGTLKFEIQW